MHSGPVSSLTSRANVTESTRQENSISRTPRALSPYLLWPTFLLAVALIALIAAGDSKPAIAGTTQRLWGDSDCSGGITPRDNQTLLRMALGQPALSQTEPCPNISDVISVVGTSHTWGDWDCSGGITTRDNQTLLRNVLSQAALSQTEPCPDIGVTVEEGGPPPPATIDWATATVAADFPHGQVRFANDDIYLYVLLDVTGDTVDEPEDYFWLGFDVNENGEIDPNVDIEYATLYLSRDLCLGEFVGPGSTNGCDPTPSSLVASFGSSPASATPHLMWEFALLLDEVQAAPGEEVRMGLRANSNNPSFVDSVPEDFDYSLQDPIVFTLTTP